jgi:hypothetical protein
VSITEHEPLTIESANILSVTYPFANHTSLSLALAHTSTGVGAALSTNQVRPGQVSSHKPSSALLPVQSRRGEKGRRGHG